MQICFGPVKQFLCDKLVFSEGKGILVTFLCLHASVHLIREQDVGGSTALAM